MKRIAKFDRLLAVLAERIFTPLDVSVPLRYREAGDGERAAAVGSDRGDWRSVDRDLVWGEPDGYYWFGGTVVLPAAAEGRRVFARIQAQFGSVMGRSDPQCLVRIDGRIAQGGDGNHREFLLTEEGAAGRKFDILIEAGTIEDRRQLGFSVLLQAHDPLAEKVYYDLKVPLDVARFLKADDARRTRILNHIEAALQTIDLRPGDDTRFAESLTAAEALAERIYADADAEAMPEIVATGHTHIDVAWLWRVRETRQKMARSMATALALMDEYSDYVFMYNQGLLLDYLASDYPELFERIKERVGEGRFEIEGALWLEPDANITGGESLVRHILHGIRYHRETFGVRPKIAWLPDTFGYSAAIPQLMEQSGLEVFVTHKLSWNDTNRMPYETFHWQGIDGTRVPAYFLTTQKYPSEVANTTYCPDLVPSHVMGTWKRYSQQDKLDELFLVYGHGDGGGGPTRAMLENVRRMEKGIPGCPRLKHEPMGPFFTRYVEKLRAEPEKFPTWVGELYLEYHRGTLTSVAKNKRNNRFAESAMHELEALAVLARERAGHRVPAARLWDLWQIVLLNQFHDILPGSSIGAVYEDSDRDYARFFAEAEALRSELAGALAGSGHMLFNVLGRSRAGLVSLPETVRALADETLVATQQVLRADGTRERIAPVADVPAIGGRAVAFAHGNVPLPEASELSVSSRHIENALLRVELDEKGRIVSLVDKRTGREAITKGAVANQLVAYQDIPMDFDAWDIDDYFEDKAWPVDDLVSAEVTETGPYRAAIRLEWRYEQSRIVEVLALEAGSGRLDVDGFVEWHEHQTLLKACFPLAIRADAVRAEIQFGHVSRAIHRNTSWDRARFEAPMHRWVDFAEPDFGVAIVNDCKYGYDAYDGVVRLTLVKSPVFPWPQADQGEHRFRYGLYVHGGVLAGDTVGAEAEAFNLPLRLIAGAGEDGAAKSLASLAEVIGEGVTIEAVKPAEDGNGFVLRLWETRGLRPAVELVLSRRHEVVEAVDLIEENPVVLAKDAERVVLQFAPFEIKTVRVRPS